MPVTGDSRLTQSDREVIHAELQKICQSAQFVRAERLQQFLRFIVEAKLNDRLTDLKESVIGIRVYLRDPDYDPKVEPIVRNEARRLRLKLDEYYGASGQDDPVIITVPKGGYIPNFEVRPEPTYAVPVQPFYPEKAEVPGRNLSKSKVAVLGLFLSALVIFAAWRVLPAANNNDDAGRMSPLTRYAGYEFQGSLSPDGKQVAFVWNGGHGAFNIYARAVHSSSNPLRLTRGPGHDLDPVWSPDGKKIAFLRITPQGKDIFLVSGSGGQERFVCHTRARRPAWVPDASLISAFSPGPAWSPDGRHLAITSRGNDAEGDSIYFVDLISGGEKRITFPGEATGDYFPAFSPRGRKLAFVRKANQPGRSGLYVQAVDDTVAREIASNLGTISGLTWLSEGRLVFSSDRTGSNRLWAISSTGGSMQALVGDEQNATQPKASPNGRDLVFTVSFRNTNIWRTSILREGQGADAVQLIASSSINHSAQYSPDGKNIVFVSDRTGTPEIWKACEDGTNPVQLTHANGLPVGSPHWSPDSREIVYDSAKDGYSAIYLMKSDGTNVRVFASARADYMMPTWSRDGRAIYFTSPMNLGSQTENVIWRKSAASGTTTMLAKGRGDVLESPDGKTIYFTRSDSDQALLQMPVSGGMASPVPDLKGVDAGRYISVGATGIYFLAKQSSPWVLNFYSFQTHRISTVAALNGVPEFGTPSLSVSPDEQTLLYSQLDQSGSDLMLWGRSR